MGDKTHCFLSIFAISGLQDYFQKTISIWQKKTDFSLFAEQKMVKNDKYS